MVVSHAIALPRRQRYDLRRHRDRIEASAFEFEDRVVGARRYLGDAAYDLTALSITMLRLLDPPAFIEDVLCDEADN